MPIEPKTFQVLLTKKTVLLCCHGLQLGLKLITYFLRNGVLTVRLHGANLPRHAGELADATDE